MRRLCGLKPYFELPPGLVLRCREVHFWCLFPEDVIDSSLLKVYESLLSCQERKEVYKAKTEKLQKERLLARTLVRTTLARYAGGCIHPSHLEFTKNNFGKPELLWPKYIVEKHGRKFPALCFNLSHTDSIIACAVTNNLMVGVDVEESKRVTRKDLMALARKKFSLKEASWLGSFQDQERQRQQFLKLWTLKVSYVKALGRGISGSPLKDFTVHLKESFWARKMIEDATALSCLSEAYTIQLELSNAAEVVLQNVGLSHDALHFLLFQPTPLQYASLCVQHPNVKADLHLSTHEDWKFYFWKTLPLAWDEPLKGATALAITG
ncbi:hypothetical protein O6H91_11G111500 [Diphasiastrum complanatum]|uniref:Uncharacterized protein n=1 Tax=Diphasiastrum complanatum TaxID=34168 RepID=A0ACC2CD17_DIPCM|nr:hypothetical protein O6H91_11G111500 [Diphasiastrum complanatum]